MDTFAAFVGTVVLMIIMVVGVALLIALPMMWMVNYLFSDAALISVFGTATIGFWKAFWLSVFCSFAFKSSSSSSKKS
jgi:hypothetical protein